LKYTSLLGCYVKALLHEPGAGSLPQPGAEMNEQSRQTLSAPVSLETIRHGYASRIGDDVSCRCLPPMTVFLYSSELLVTKRFKEASATIATSPFAMACQLSRPKHRILKRFDPSLLSRPGP